MDFDYGSVVTVTDRDGEWRVFGYDRTIDAYLLTSMEPSENRVLSEVPPEDMVRVGEIAGSTHEARTEVVYDRD